MRVNVGMGPSGSDSDSESNVDGGGAPRAHVNAVTQDMSPVRVGTALGGRVE